MKKVIEAVPSRHNWDQFCEEPELTKAEWREWRRMAAAIREDTSGKLLDAVMAATAEYDKLPPPPYTVDWSDMVAWSDQHIRIKRAELAWWREYQTKGEEHGTDQETDVR